MTRAARRIPFQAQEETGSEAMSIDWSGCDEVEQVPGKVSGVPILKHSRVSASA